MAQQLQSQYLAEFQQAQEQTIKQHREQVESLEFQLSEVQQQALQSSLINHEQHKYDDRLTLIKKMHFEEIQEIKRVNRERETDLETKIINYERER